ncbi:MAG: helix-turn-helix domain-containing protein [Solirubrobacteraceae bacterium]
MTTPKSTTFGQQLRKLRTERGISQDGLARNTGIHSTAIGRFEHDAREPRLKSILRLADGLNVNPGALLDPIGERRLTPEAFEQHFGHLPTDGEG